MTPDTILRSGSLTVVFGHARWFRVVALTSPATAAEFMAQCPWAWAALDGSMFSVLDGRGYDTTRSVRLDYTAIDPKTGTSAPGRYPERGATITVASGKATVHQGGNPVDWLGAEVVWQGYPTIIEDGVVVATTARNTDRTERAAVAVLDDSTLAFVSGVGTMHGFAQDVAAAIRPRWLIYTDGGQSRALAVRVGDTLEADLPSNLTARRVASFVAFTSDAQRFKLSLPTGNLAVLG